MPDIPAATEVGESEGEVNIIAWAGFVEDGSTNPDADWVTEFEKETQCKVNRKVGATSDEMVQLMRTGEYDLLSASGDASLRLIAGGDVAPINTDLIPNFGHIVDGLKGQIYDTLNGKSYGVPIGRGANVLMYNTKDVPEAPDSWEATWTRAASTPARSCLRFADLHCGRRGLPDGHPAGPRHHQPVRAGPGPAGRRG